MGRAATFFLLIMAVAIAQACRHPGDAGSARRGVAGDALDGTWYLTHLGGTRVIEGSLDARPSIRFAEEGRIEGYGGCNGFSAPYVLDGEHVRLSGPAISTKRACVDPAMNSQEQRFLSSLESLSRYSIDGDVLTLFSDSGVIARFERG